MGKSKMDDAAAERIRKARGDKDSFSKRAADAARRNDQGSSQSSSSSSATKVKTGDSKSVDKK
ncbi:hypothetical protein C8A05DRAFT_29892 [Staphylotrichum tortipilum]|uniref:Uncharacterized protein n=1 Tax=Staphylotrichum tortipilum TaxID=2831512 RepID=A0AAN6RWN8_9PEZI|nr:hypothetical protein C8A05DRAFT_29892 [Staphylotrichum longicolle]